jgi:hypothetical protein
MAKRKRLPKQRIRKWKDYGEVRLNHDGSVDEVVASNCDIHIEQMDDGHWWIGISAGPKRMWASISKCYNRIDTMHVNLSSKSKVAIRVETDEP